MYKLFLPGLELIVLLSLLFCIGDANVEIPLTGLVGNVGFGGTGLPRPSPKEIHES